MRAGRGASILPPAERAGRPRRDRSAPLEVALPHDVSGPPAFARVRDRVVESLSLETELEHEPVEVAWGQFPGHRRNEPLEEGQAVSQRELVGALYQLTQHRVIELFGFLAGRHTSSSNVFGQVRAAPGTMGLYAS